MLAIRDMLLQSPDLRKVANMETQVKGNLSDDASQSLVSLLQVACQLVLHRKSALCGGSCTWARWGMTRASSL